MATYAQRPDGLYEVTLDDGRTMPTALDPSVLEAQGFIPQNQPPPPMPGQRMAGLGDLGTRPMVPGADALGASPAFGRLMGAGQQRLDAPPAPAPPPPAPTQNMSAMPEGGMSREPPPSPPSTEDAAQQGSSRALEDEISRGAYRFMMEELKRGGAPAQRIPGGERIDTREVKYKQYPGVDPQVLEDIGESRIDQQLATQDTAEQSEQAQAMQARVAANEARDLQRQVEETVQRKGNIEREIGERMQAIDARLAKARAVTESGSARERVMRDKGSFGRILAVIGQALATFAMPQTGGRNIVTEQINREVDEEMKREEALYDVSPETSQLKTYIEAWGSPESARKEMALAKREAVQAQMEAWVRRAGAERIPVEFRQWLADEALAIQQAKAALGQEATVEVVEKWKNVPDKYVGGGGVDPVKAAERAARLADAERKIFGVHGRGDVKNQASYMKFKEQGVVQLPDGRLGYHPNADTANKIEKALHTIPPWRENLRQMLGIYEQRGGVSSASKLNPDDRARLEVLAVQSFDGMKAVAEEAMTSGEDATFWAKLRGSNTTDFFRWASDKAALEQAIRATQQFERSRMNRLRQLPPELDRSELPGPLVQPRPPSFRERK